MNVTFTDERLKYGPGAKLPSSEAEVIEVRLRAWLDTPQGMAWETWLRGSDEWCADIVAALAAKGYDATGARKLLACDCDEHNGALAPSDWYVLTIRRPYE